jgi:hypothetical protein
MDDRGAAPFPDRLRPDRPLPQLGGRLESPCEVLYELGLLVDGQYVYSRELVDQSPSSHVGRQMGPARCAAPAPSPSPRRPTRRGLPWSASGSRRRDAGRARHPRPRTRRHSWDRAAARSTAPQLPYTYAELFKVGATSWIGGIVAAPGLPPPPAVPPQNSMATTASAARVSYLIGFVDVGR